MKIKSVISVSTGVILAAWACLGQATDNKRDHWRDKGNNVIALQGIRMISPNDKKDISLKKLSSAHFYTITCTLVNNSDENVDYNVTTAYATTSEGNIGKVTTDDKPLVKSGDAYKGHLDAGQHSTVLTITHVKPDHGVALKDNLQFENTTKTKIGASFRVSNCTATKELEDSQSAATL